MRRLQIALSAALLIAMQGCGGSETHETNDQTSSGGPPIEAGDGRYHPPANNTHVSEAAACDALAKAQDDRVQALKCSITSRLCPALLRAEFITACMEYDEGSVQGCVDYYLTKKTCDDLKDAFENCVVTPYPGTEPNGCPP
jgi:hypothetical protein